MNGKGVYVREECLPSPSKLTTESPFLYLQGLYWPSIEVAQFTRTCFNSFMHWNENLSSFRNMHNLHGGGHKRARRVACTIQHNHDNFSWNLARSLLPTREQSCGRRPLSCIAGIRKSGILPRRSIMVFSFVNKNCSAIMVVLPNTCTPSTMS